MSPMTDDHKSPRITPLLLSIADAGKTLSISRTKCWEMVNRGEIESVRLGGRRLIPTEALEDFVARIRMEQNP